MDTGTENLINCRKQYRDRGSIGLRVRARANMKERKMNLTSCWMERSNMKLLSNDCAIGSALSSATVS